MVDNGLNLYFRAIVIDTEILTAGSSRTFKVVFTSLQSSAVNCFLTVSVKFL